MTQKPFNSVVILYSNNGIPNIKFSELSYSESVKKCNMLKNNKYISAFVVLNKVIDELNHIDNIIYEKYYDKTYDLETIETEETPTSIYLNKEFLLTQWEELYYRNLSLAIDLVKKYGKNPEYQYEIDNILKADEDKLDELAQLNIDFDLLEEFLNSVYSNKKIPINMLSNIVVYAENQIGTSNLCNEIFEIFAPEFI